MKIIVVGGGLFGSIVAARLRRRGDEVLVYDDERSNAGSRVAACVMRPSWISSMDREQYADALRLLDEEFGVSTLSFRVMGKSAPLHWCSPRRILASASAENGAVRCVKESYTYALCLFEDGSEQRADRVVVAAGVWSHLHAERPLNLSGRGGWAHTWAGTMQEGVVRPWAPYRQVVTFERYPGEIWSGDGQALLPASMDKERRAASLRRCVGEQVQPELVHTRSGMRPYVRGLKAPALVVQRSPRVWIATGGAKNGTLGAAWAARKLEEELI